MIVMLCTRSRGGMLSVVEAYRHAGLFERHPVCILYTHDEGSPAYRLALALWALLRFALMLLRGQVTLVHAHISMHGSFWRKCVFASLARRFGVPVIGHLHGSDFDHFVAAQPGWLHRVIVGQLERLTTVLVLGDRWRNIVLSIAPTARVLVLPNFVRVPSGGSAHAMNDRVELLFLGEVGQRKGAYDLLEAFAAARAQCSTLRLTVAGSGDLEKAAQMAAALGITDAVTFTGWLDGDAKTSLLQRSDIYVLPSHSEGLPISILEAMSWGLPVVSTDVGSIAELVRHDTDGLLVPAGEPDLLARAIARLASSRELRVRMGQSGRHRVAEAFSEDALLPRLERLYGDLLSSARTSTREGSKK